MKKIYALIIVGTVLLFEGKAFSCEVKTSASHNIKYFLNEMQAKYFHASNFITDEIDKTKEYQKVEWSKGKEQIANLNNKAKIQLKGFFNKFPERN